MFDAAGLGAAIRDHGRVVRVVIAGFEGSSPREVGAAMLVWPGGFLGTIGGGALEWEALARARAMLKVPPTPVDRPPTPVDRPPTPVDRPPTPVDRPPTPDPSPRGGGGAPGTGVSPRPSPPPRGEGSGVGGRSCEVQRVALGPSLGQCCGGAVTLWYERFDRVPEVADGVFARGPGVMPLAVKRTLARARGEGVLPVPGLVQGWLVEPVAQPLRQVWVWGAGHVGRAVVEVLAPLPGVAVTWCDVDTARFPDVVPEGVRVIARADVAEAVAEAAGAAEHLVMTFSHALDLELCHRLLRHGFGTCGLIGSATKRARFRARLAALAHQPAQIARIQCPIGDPSLGKHPQAIAIGVAAAFLSHGIAKDVKAHG